MPRRLKTAKFFMYAAKKSGRLKNKRLLGVNTLNPETANVTLQDLLSEEGISPSEVELPHGFITHAKGK